MAVKIIDKAIKFIKLSEDALDRAFNTMAIDIERLSKAQVPHDKGQLKASGGHRKTGLKKYVIEYFKEYALYQELGMRKDGSHRVTNYSKAGKKKHFLLDPSKLITSRSSKYFRVEVDRINI